MSGHFRRGTRAETTHWRAWSDRGCNRVGWLTRRGRAGDGAPRTPEGKPDFSGIWEVLSKADYNIEAHSASRPGPASAGIVAGGEPPHQTGDAREAETALRRACHRRHRGQVLPARRSSRCIHPAPVSDRADARPGADAVRARPRNAQRLHELAAPERGPLDWWMGDSRGTWDGDTLVVDANNFNEETWFDRAGNFHSDALHVVEQHTLADRDQHQLHGDDRGCEGLHAPVDDEPGLLPPYRAQLPRCSITNATRSRFDDVPSCRRTDREADLKVGPYDPGGLSMSVLRSTLGIRPHPPCHDRHRVRPGRHVQRSRPRPGRRGPSRRHRHRDQRQHGRDTHDRHQRRRALLHAGSRAGRLRGENGAGRLSRRRRANA